MIGHGIPRRSLQASEQVIHGMKDGCAMAHGRMGCTNVIWCKSAIIPLCLRGDSHIFTRKRIRTSPRYALASFVTMPVSEQKKQCPAATPQSFTIVREDRERLAGHRGRVIWFTGLSGAGKSTLANALEIELHRSQKRTYVLDGDNLRRGLCKDLDFSDADRVENMRRVAEVARLFADAGVVVLVAFISPFRAERQAARELFASGDFLEVFVDVPLAVAEQRDTKGLYKQARSGALPRLTGVDSPYEPPFAPDLALRTDLLSIESCVDRMLTLLETPQSDVPGRRVFEPHQRESDHAPSP